MEDLKAAGASVAAYPELRSCLEVLKGDVPPLDEREIALATDRAVIEDLRKIAADKEFELGELASWSVSTFLTEKTDVLAVSFELTHEATVTLLEGASPINAVLVVTGDCSFDMRQKSASGLRLDQVRLLDPEGNLIEGKAVSYLYGAVTIGGRPRSRPYELRLPLEPQDLDDLLRTVQSYDR